MFKNGRKEYWYVVDYLLSFCTLKQVDHILNYILSDENDLRVLARVFVETSSQTRSKGHSLCLDLR